MICITVYYVFLDTLSEGILNMSVRVLWTIYMLVSNVTSILALLYTVTMNRNHMTNVLCLLSRVDNKLFPNKSKQSAYSQHRSHVIMQLWVTFISYVTASASWTYSYYNDMSKCTMYFVPQIVGTTINAVMIFQYVNLVRNVKQRYHLLLEADSATEFDTSRCLCVEDITRHNNNNNNNKRMFSPTKDNLKSNIKSRSLCTIQDLQTLYSELYDVL